MCIGVRLTSILFLLSLIVPIWEVHAEVFTALADIEPLLETHKKIIDDLDDYIQKGKKKLDILKSHIGIYKKEHSRAMEDIPNYLGNPIHAFTLIKRLTTDLDKMEKNIKMGTEYIKNITMTQPDIKYPTNEDLTGAAQALTRLQQTYELHVQDLSQGIISGVNYSSPMTSSDCFELGRNLYNAKEYHNALPWFLEALKKYEYIEYNGFNEADLMEYVAYANYFMNKLDEALDWTYRLLERYPTHVLALGNVQNFKNAIAEKEEKRRRRERGESGEDLEDRPYTVNTYYSPDESSRYEALCRGEMVLPDELYRELKCRYVSDTHPYLKIGPMKAEQIYKNPDVFVFHEVLSDNEIDHIESMARPRFKRAGIYNPETGANEVANYRISKAAWIKDEESDIIARISQRVSDMTGLSMLSAEELQVSNYGIGGHYEPHYDFDLRDDIILDSDYTGNRIATVLFYMSDVAQGGATVFTELGLTVFPIRRAALYWLNLHPSGEGNFATRHAACPVLRGSKWVSNKWIHQGGQELIRPCNLEYQDEGFVTKIPKAVQKKSRR